MTKTRRPYHQNRSALQSKHVGLTIKTLTVISALLFVLLLSDLPAILRERHPTVRVTLYADDMVLYCRARTDLQSCLHTVQELSASNGLTINVEKTKAMKFRRGGRPSRFDRLRVNGQQIEFVNFFCYLGVTLSFTLKSFGRHLSSRCAKSHAAIASIRAPTKLSMRTVLALFNIKVASVASYGIEITWEKLTVAQLRQLDGVKLSYLKRALGVHRNARNRLVYLLCRTEPFCVELRDRFDLPETPAFLSVLATHRRKLVEVEPDFFDTPAMRQEDWREPLAEQRSLLCRHAVHGFHGELCEAAGFHDPRDSCVCRHCGEPCPRYHLLSCPVGLSLSQCGQKAPSASATPPLPLTADCI